MRELLDSGAQADLEVLLDAYYMSASPLPRRLRNKCQQKKAMHDTLFRTGL
jgi:hypothetical protein